MSHWGKNPLIIVMLLLSCCILYAQTQEKEVSPGEEAQEEKSEVETEKKPPQSSGEAQKKSEVETKEKNLDLPIKPGCACIKSINKLRRVERAARKYGASMSRVYRIDEKYTLSPETITEALHCHCARSITKKVVSPQAAPPLAPAQERVSRLSLEGKDVALLSPGEQKDTCRLTLELDYEFKTPLKFKQAADMFRNLAAEIGSDTVVVTRYERNKGASAKILQCDPEKIRAMTFADLKLKRFPDYIFDPKTGLAWQRCSHGQEVDGVSCEGEIKKSDFSTAREVCPALGSISNRKWRLPEVDELSTLVREQGGGEAQIDLDFFPATPPEVYWSSTPYWNKAAAMGLDFESGKKIAYDKNKEGHVRCVIDLIPDVELPQELQ